MPYFYIPAIIDGRQVLNNIFGAHIDENGLFRNNSLDQVDYYGNLYYPPVIYLDGDDVNYNPDEEDKPYYQQYPERNKYMDIVYQEYLRNQPGVALPEAPPAHMVRALDGKECGPRHGPANRRWTRPQLVELAHQANIPNWYIRELNTIPKLCDALYDFRVPAAYPPARHGHAVPICRNERPPRGSNSQTDLTLESAKNLARRYRLNTSGPKPNLCERLISHNPPLARRPLRGEGRRTKRKHRTKKRYSKH